MHNTVFISSVIAVFLGVTFSSPIIAMEKTPKNDLFFSVEHIGGSFKATKDIKRANHLLSFEKGDEVVYGVLTKYGQVTSSTEGIGGISLFPCSFFTKNWPVSVSVFVSMRMEKAINETYCLIFDPNEDLNRPLVPREGLLKIIGSSPYGSDVRFLEKHGIRKVVNATVKIPICTAGSFNCFKEFLFPTDVTAIKSDLKQYGFSDCGEDQPLICVQVDSQDHNSINNFKNFPVEKLIDRAGNKIVFKDDGATITVLAEDGTVYIYTFEGFQRSADRHCIEYLFDNFYNRHPGLRPKENITPPASRSFFSLSRNSFFVAVAGMVMFGTTIFALLKTNKWISCFLSN